MQAFADYYYEVEQMRDELEEYRKNDPILKLEALEADNSDTEIPF